MRRSLVLGLLGVISVSSVLVLAGCGGGESDKESEGAKVSCAGSAIQATKLPSGFPKPDAVTYTKATTQGPSQLVNGYFAGELKDAHDEYKQAFENAAGYTVLSDELDEHDSEVNYKGAGHTGQVALKENCEQDGRISVHITSRPS